MSSPGSVTGLTEPSAAPCVAAVRRALPPHFYDQETLLEKLEAEWSQRHFNLGRLRRLHENVLVGGRHLALPIERYPELSGFGESNDAWIEAAVELGADALAAAVAAAGLELADVDALFFVSVTGIATPSIDARLMNRLSLSPNLKRIPIFGLGCVAGAAGLARAQDYLRAYPDQVAVLLSVELCSLTLQREDLSIPNLIASGLFGDGAAAAVLLGAERTTKAMAPDVSVPAPVCPKIAATRSVFYRETEHIMGWDIGTDGFKVVLSADVPKMVEDHLRADVDSFLADNGLDTSAVAHWICHPGGPKVLQAMESAFELSHGELERTWKSLREVGNLSSSSVLFVLSDLLSELALRAPAPAAQTEWGLLLAMGPGFCSELVLLRFDREAVNGAAT
jgi:alkylresorcinol/alkylpyrone synthase